MNKIKYLLFLILFITTGCVNYTELNDIGIINAIGINKNNDDFIINVNMLTPTTNNLEENKTYEVKAPSLNEAFDKLYLSTYKDINLSHLELLILDKDLRKDDYDAIKTFFLNRIESRNTFNTIILENYNKDNIFKFTTEEINSLIETNSNQDGIVSYKTFDELVEDILTLNISYIPTVKIDEKIKILGYRSIYSENKLLSLRESISYNFLTNKIKKCNLVDENLNIKVDKSITTMKVNKNIITININSTLTNYGKEENIINIYNTTLKKYINQYLQNNNLEYFNEIIKKYDYNYYKKTKKDNIKFNIIVNSKLNKEAYKNNE